MSNPTRAEFEKLKDKVEDPKTGLEATRKIVEDPSTGLAAVRNKVEDPNTGLAAASTGLAAVKAQVSAPRTGLLDRVTKIESVGWFKEQWAKGDIQLAATHAQAFKFDYSAIKFDEKGLTIFGRPVLGSDVVTSNRVTKKFVDRLNGRVDELWKRVTGRSLSGPPAPTAADLQKIDAKVSGLKGQLTRHVNTSFKNLATEVTRVSRDVVGLRKDLTKSSGTATDAARDAKDVRKELGKVRTFAGNAHKRADEAFKKAHEAATAAKSARVSADKAIKQVKDLNRQADGTSQDIRRLHDAIQKLDAALR